jgi:hypothetical protein
VTPLIRKAVKFAPEPETALWFDVGQMESVQAMKVPADFLMHLPSKRTGIAGLDTGGKDFAIWLLQGDGSVTVGGCSMWHGGKYFPPYAYIATEEGFKVYRKGEEITLEDVKPVHRMVLAVLTKLAAKSEGYSATPQRTFINQKRQSKGKSALTFDWHTVVIEPPKEKNDSQGGTHASPRRHQVRGHWRTYKSGKRGWVNECWKGDASKGVVFKDYKLKENND